MTVTSSEIVGHPGPELAVIPPRGLRTVYNVLPALL
jgi:hypothetical protein